MMGVYEPGHGRWFHATEQAEVHASILRLAERHGAGAVTGQAATRDLFAAVVQRSAAFHFHGHCMLDRKVLADQSLELADGTLPVRAVFDIKLRAPHITLVACDSASQGIAAGDEPLGLVTALLCAGAGSVVGTIWPTASRTGRHFADEFYAELEAQRGASPALSTGGGDIFDLAAALRRAVLALRECNNTRLRQYKDIRRPYHWAAFVLHGSWFMRRSGGDVHNGRDGRGMTVDEDGRGPIKHSSIRPTIHVKASSPALSSQYM
jgi:CHAT domain-containing protein